MKALLLAAGLGTRLRPFTFFRAKATLPLWNVPFIRFPLQYLLENKVEEVVINLHAHPDSIRKAARSEYRGIKIEYSHEPEILGTAGAIRKASGLLGKEPFVVMNSDMLTTIDLSAVLTQHVQTNALVTLVVMKAGPFEQYRGLHFEGAPLQLSGVGSGPGEKYHYTGLQIVSPEVVPFIPPDQKSDVFKDIYPQFISEGRMYGFLYEGLWKEIGTLREYLATSLEMHSNQIPASLIPAGATPGLVSPGVNVSSDAVVQDSILMENVTVEGGSRIDRCIIGWDTTVNKNYRNAALIRGVLPWYIS